MSFAGEAEQQKLTAFWGVCVSTTDKDNFILIHLEQDSGKHGSK